MQRRRFLSGDFQVISGPQSVDKKHLRSFFVPHPSHISRAQHQQSPQRAKSFNDPLMEKENKNKQKRSTEQKDQKGLCTPYYIAVILCQI